MRADAGRKYRAYPTREQEQVLTRWGHTARALWNVALEQRVYLWEQRRYTLRSVEQCTFLTAARADLDWIGDLPAQSGQQILRQLDRAYDNFWNAHLPARFPSRRKRGHRLSVPFPGQAVEVRKLNRKWAEVRLPKVGWLRFRLSRAIGGTIRNATVSQDGNGWHISFGVHTGRKPDAPNGKPTCGVDFGVAASAFVSTESTPRLMPPTLTASERKRLKALEQRKARQITYAKKHNGGTYSHRLRTTIAHIAKLTTRRANRRRDFTHKLTTDLAKSHGLIGIEDLRVRNMTASAKGTTETPGKNVRSKAALNRSVLDNTPGERRRQLDYKTRMYGSVLVAVPPFHTSQTCAACGLVDPGSRKGCGRHFTCTRCGHEDDADHNASMEIEARARRTGGSDINSTRSIPRVRVPAAGRRRMREAPKPAHAS
ncbi:transposase [Streptomyces sp. NBC_00555]|uniref:RNA-guided endonuclease InsQ/TnpB family protein n=1 Tax=unclassified Streptomyces TaxID=2593676 RepID=UPI00214C723A|nr:MULTISPECIES: transposase [unclassified Streptomyces]MCX5010941.1 transposase [Streptomyces sp. NBC_00555]UUU39284.1 transposase [Streptomyces sp. NBC_00162]